MANSIYLTHVTEKREMRISMFKKLFRNFKTNFPSANSPSPVLLGDRLDVKIPRVYVEMCDAHSRIVSYDVIVNCLNRFCVGFHPSNLRAGVVRVGKFDLFN